MPNVRKPIDARTFYLKDFLQKDGYQAMSADEYLQTTPSVSRHLIVLLPLPAEKEQLQALLTITPHSHLLLGGNLPSDFKKDCQEKHIPYLDYMDFPEITWKNAIATAEGAVCEAIQKSAINLQDSDCLIIGYGVCGKILADKLYGLKCHVYISTRSPEAQAQAIARGYALHQSYSSYRFIFNTAPAPVLSQTTLKQLSTDCLIIDIASKPGGTDFAYCEKKGIPAYLCPGLPGRYAPKSSAIFIYQQIQDILREFQLFYR